MFNRKQIKKLEEIGRIDNETIDTYKKALKVQGGTVEMLQGTVTTVREMLMDHLEQHTKTLRAANKCIDNLQQQLDEKNKVIYNFKDHADIGGSR